MRWWAGRFVQVEPRGFLLGDVASLEAQGNGGGRPGRGESTQICEGLGVADERRMALQNVDVFSAVIFTALPGRFAPSRCSRSRRLPSWGFLAPISGHTGRSGEFEQGGTGLRASRWILLASG